MLVAENRIKNVVPQANTSEARRRQAEAILRDVAFVLKMTAKVKQQMGR